jgi:hypothetical protein
VITAKALLCLLVLIPLIPLGFLLDESLLKVSLGFFFLALLFSTFNLDLLLMGFEKLPNGDRLNYIIVLTATRITGIGLVSVMFYFTERWVYLILVLVASMTVIIPLFIKYVQESPLYVMTTTAD